MPWIHAAALGSFLVCAVACDVRQRRVPNLLVATFALGALVIAWGADGVPGVRTAAGGLGVGLALLLVPFACGRIGAGDAKFLGTVGVFLGPRLTLEAFLAGSILGGVTALVALALRARQTGLPYTAPLAAGVVVALGLDGVPIGLV